MRLALLFCVVLCTGIMPASARNLDAKFLIERKGKVIGHHTVKVREASGETFVETEIEMKVKLGPIRLFGYQHNSEEVWRDGALVSLTSHTDNNGEETEMMARLEADQLIIKGRDYQGPAPENSVPSSYWDKSLIEADALINTQTGEIIDITVERVGESNAPHNQLAEHYRITGSLTLNIWYDGQRWVGSNFIIDGEELTYVLSDEKSRQYAALNED